jgi:hypothetical protein
MIEKIVQTAKQTEKAIVLDHSALSAPGAGRLLLLTIAVSPRSAICSGVRLAATVREAIDQNHLEWDSASCHAHVPRNCRCAANPEVVPPGLASQQPVEKLVNRLGTAGAERIAKLNLLVVAETAVDRPSGCDPDPIAAFTEIVGERRDETDPGTQFQHFIVTGRSARPYC